MAFRIGIMMAIGVGSLVIGYCIGRRHAKYILNEARDLLEKVDAIIEEVESLDLDEGLADEQ